MHRRRFLLLGFCATALAGLVGAGVTVLRSPFDKHGTLTPSASRVMRAIATAVLEGSLPESAEARSTQLDAHLGRLATTIAGLSPAARDDLGRLLGILHTVIGRRWLMSLQTDWPDASVAEISDALETMRASSSALRQQAYHALRDLTNAAYYAAPEAWPRLGYPGPVTT